MYRQSILFISDYSKWSESACQYIRSVFTHTMSLSYERGDPPSEILNDWQGDWIFSFKSELLLPSDLIMKAKCGALNFHPSPPKYRGIGGYILALRNLDKQFGVTCHHMNNMIDSGQIIMTSYFKVRENETVLSLYHKTAFHCLRLLFDVVDLICLDEQLPQSNEKWGRQLFKYAEFQKDLEILKSVERKGSIPSYKIDVAVNDGNL